MLLYFLKKSLSLKTENKANVGFYKLNSVCVSCYRKCCFVCWQWGGVVCALWIRRLLKCQLRLPSPSNISLMHLQSPIHVGKAWPEQISLKCCALGRQILSSRLNGQDEYPDCFSVCLALVFSWLCCHSGHYSCGHTLRWLVRLQKAESVGDKLSNKNKTPLKNLECERKGETGKSRGISQIAQGTCARMACQWLALFCLFKDCKLRAQCATMSFKCDSCALQVTSDNSKGLLHKLYQYIYIFLHMSPFLGYVLGWTDMWIS